MGVLLLSSLAGAQQSNAISAQEFRQSLLDYAGMVDAQHQTQYAKKLAGVPDAIMARWSLSVPNGRRFQSAVAALKAAHFQPPMPSRRASAGAEMDARP